MISIDLRSNTAFIGRFEVPVRSIGNRGNIQVAFPYGPVLRPLSTLERLHNVGFAATAKTPASCLATVTLDAATVTQGTGNPRFFEIIALHLAGAGLEAPPLYDTILAVANSTGWEIDQILEAEAALVDRLAIATSSFKSDSLWNRLIMLTEGDHELDAIRDMLAESLLCRLDKDANKRGWDTWVPQGEQCENHSDGRSHNLPGTGNVLHYNFGLDPVEQNQLDQDQREARTSSVAPMKKSHKDDWLDNGQEFDLCAPPINPLEPCVLHSTPSNPNDLPAQYNVKQKWQSGKYDSSAVNGRRGDLPNTSAAYQPVDTSQPDSARVSNQQMTNQQIAGRLAAMQHGQPSQPSAPGHFQQHANRPLDSLLHTSRAMVSPMASPVEIERNGAPRKLFQATQQRMVSSGAWAGESGDFDLCDLDKTGPSPFINAFQETRFAANDDADRLADNLAALLNFEADMRGIT